MPHRPGPAGNKQGRGSGCPEELPLGHFAFPKQALDCVCVVCSVFVCVMSMWSVSVIHVMCVVCVFIPVCVHEHVRWDPS